MRVIFLGTPAFALKSLEKLMEHHQVVAVVTQPDKPSGRGNKVLPSEVKVFAQQHNIPVYQFAKIGRDGVETLSKLKPDIMVTVAYGQILTQQIIDIPKYGILNVHASLLPKYRGASPIQSAIIKGEKETGITIMQTDIGLDTGDILATAKVDILPDDTAKSLGERLAVIGADLLIDTISKIEKQQITRIKQIHADATFTTKISKNDCYINWQKSAEQIKCLIMGANPDPIASTLLRDTVVKIYTASVADISVDENFENGTILPISSCKAGVFVRCASGILKLGLVQLPGGKVMEATQLLNGRKIKIGDMFEQIVQLED